MSLAHYIVVRRDLPLGVVCAMITHAAGESGALYQDPYDGRFRGATAVVLGVDSQEELDSVTVRLFQHNIPHVRIWESEGAYAKQFMAIGVVPGDRDTIYRALSTLPILKDLLDNPTPTC